MQKSPRSSRRLSRALLRSWPLPKPESDDDKEGRGRVLIVGGEVALPGALILAGIAAMRSGAGKLQIATCRSIAPHVGVAVPESMSIGLSESAGGVLAPSAAKELRDYVARTDSILIGPGMRDSDDTDRFTRNLLSERERAAVAVDAGALRALHGSPRLLHKLQGNAVLTPHAGEMSAMLGEEKEEIETDPAAYSVAAAKSLGAVIALKGSTTFVATPAGELFQYEAGDIGLATSGSGDVLAGIIAGLLARGASPLTATLWGVFIHGTAGNALAKRVGRVGYLARELLDEIPHAMNGR